MTEIKITGSPQAEPEHVNQEAARAIVEILKVAERVADRGGGKVETRQAAAILFSAFSTFHIRSLSPDAPLNARLTITRKIMGEGLRQLLWAVRKDFLEDKH